MLDLLKLYLGELPEMPERGDELSPFAAMRLAISLAWRGVGRVSPNPMVGCVIVSADHRYLASGFHAQAGGPHAEIAALAELAGVSEFSRDQSGWRLQNIPNPEFMNLLKGARVYVSLEPCAHEGKTPSCAKTLAALPIQEVVYGLEDPNPLVAGQGLEILRQKGIRCRPFQDLSPRANLKQELIEVCEHFLLNIQQKRPFVTLKVASSLDGAFALKSGESQWITNERSRRLGHFLRGAHDAILVGRGTLDRDDPSLNIRHPFFANVRKKLVVVDTRGQLLEKRDLKIFKIHEPENLIWAVGEDYQGTPERPVHILRVPSDERGLDLGELQKQLWDFGVRSLFIEAGGKTLSAHLRSETADRLYLFQAPILLGAQNSRIWTEGFGVEKLADRVSLSLVRRADLDEDGILTGRFLYHRLMD